MVSRLFILAVAFLVVGCASPKRDVRVRIEEDPEVAREKNKEGVELIQAGHYEDAVTVLTQATAADRSNGTVHNNLGKAYFHLGNLYQAAWAFENAAKLMPNAAEPRNNLGLVYEKIGQWDKAVEQYAAALKLAEENIEIVGNLARARIRRGDKGEDLRTLLQQILLKDARPEWQTWAREQLGRF